MDEIDAERKHMRQRVDNGLRMRVSAGFGIRDFDACHESNRFRVFGFGIMGLGLGGAHPQACGETNYVHWSRVDVSSLGFRVSGSRFLVFRFGFRVSGFWFRVLGFVGWV